MNSPYATQGLVRGSDSNGPLPEPRNGSSSINGSGPISNGSHPRLIGQADITPPQSFEGFRGEVAAEQQWRQWRQSPEDEDEIDDEDDSADEHEDSWFNSNTDENPIDDIEPTLSGFRAHILQLNPSLNAENDYLVDRIAEQQVARLGHLASRVVNHRAYSSSAPCPSGSLCSLGGTATWLIPEMNSNGSPITRATFAPDIPMPRTPRFPAVVECQLCFKKLTLLKPSDWSKHVHEDVQPFTCTWPGCRDPQTFKRKADWVRHESECHRRVDWWECDVDGCRHKCHRRDNFIQHLTREHGFARPESRLKSGDRREPIWAKVLGCYREANKRPEDDPCRFCGEKFSAWQRLRVHVAKHMELITLPILRLVPAKARELLLAQAPLTPEQQQDEPPSQTEQPLMDTATARSATPVGEDSLFVGQVPEDQEWLFVDGDQAIDEVLHQQLQPQLHPHQQLEQQPVHDHYDHHDQQQRQQQLYHQYQQYPQHPQYQQHPQYPQYQHHPQYQQTDSSPMQQQQYLLQQYSQPQYLQPQYLQPQYLQQQHLQQQQPQFYAMQQRQHPYEQQQLQLNPMQQQQPFDHQWQQQQQPLFDGMDWTRTG